MSKKNTATFFAILAAVFYAINIPLSKILLNKVEPTMMAALLYLGAGIGLLVYSFICKSLGKAAVKEPLTKKELPYTVAMIVLDIAAPILLMIGITKTSSANVSLLNNFEIVATSLIAFLIFKEVLSKRLIIAVIMVTLASVILGFEGADSFTFNTGSLFVIAACVCWGFENNCTKMLSGKSSVEIVMIKGCFSGLGSLIIAFAAGERLRDFVWIAAVLALGFVAYGLSINFYIMAQKELGAAKTSAYYSVAPFLGVAFSMIILKERPHLQFYIALAIMAVSTVIIAKDTITLQHTHIHQHIHTHEHRHGNIVHTHQHIHEHSHLHVHNGNENEHNHSHNDLSNHEHSHSGKI